MPQEKREVSDVVSENDTGNTFTYECKINGNDYICEQDTAGPDNVLAKYAAIKMGLEIDNWTQTDILGDRTDVRTEGTTTATVEVGGGPAK